MLNSKQQKQYEQCMELLGNIGEMATIAIESGHTNEYTPLELIKECLTAIDYVNEVQPEVDNNTTSKHLEGKTNEEKKLLH